MEDALQLILFLLRYWSSTSSKVDERPKAKSASASGGICPLTPDQGLCPWTPLGALAPPRYRLKPGNLLSDITDHLPNYMILLKNKPVVSK